ncbi:MAG: ELWxxDGT repeat protein [Cyanobacteriota bacterium]|nr:ELWxxDGT repeat protein [Cyanobacteriota bacterium]
MGARLVRDLNPAGSSSPESFISIDGLLYFTAVLSDAAPTPSPGNDGATDSGNEDGTIALSTTEGPSQALGQGLALLKSDGTEAGTKVLKEFTAINDLVEVNGDLYFIADDGTGNRLWRSNGTARGTVLVKDLYPGADPNFPQDLFEIDGILFYGAINSNPQGETTAENGYELWRREGENIGTPMFKNIIPDKIITGLTIEIDSDTGEITTTVTTSEAQNNSFPRDFTSVNGNIFFVAATPYFMEAEEAQEDPLNLLDRDIVGGLELWFSDGTESGTNPIIINRNLYDYYGPTDYTYGYIPNNLYFPDYGFTTNSASSFPRELTAFGSNLIFVANDGIHGFELWKVDAEGNQLDLIADLSPGNTSSSPEQLTVVGDRLYFTADTGSGRKLWSTSSQLETPSLVNGGGDDPKHLTAIEDELYYSAKSELGRELWAAAGTSASLVADINPGSQSSSPKDFTSINHWIDRNIETHLYFSANEGQRGIELWSLNLSSDNANPERQADIFSGPYSSEPRQLTDAENNLYFTADDGDCGRELWTLGVTIDGPHGQMGPSPTTIESDENQMQVYQFTSDANVIWGLNGGLDADLFEIQPDGRLSFKQSPTYNNLNDHNRDNSYEVVIRATDLSNGITTDQKINVEVVNVIDIEQPGGGQTGEEDGAEGAPDILTEEKQREVYSFSASESVEWSINGDDSQLFSINSNGVLRFIEPPLFDDPSDSNEDNIYDIKVSATNPLSGSSDEQDIAIEVVYAVDIQGPSGEPGAEQSYIQTEERVKDVFNFSSEKAASWELAGGEDQSLFEIKSNGDLKFKQSPYHEKPLDSGKDNIYEVIIGARNPEKGNLSTQIVEIEVIESHKLDFSLIKNIYPASTGSNPTSLTEFNNSILFSANDGKKGTELWQSDGTKTKTSRLKDINKGSDSSTPTGFTTYNNKAYFTANDGKKGQELWVTNGSEKGTELLADINAGAASSSPSDLLWFNQSLFFAADDSRHGRELWHYNPLTNKVKLVDDIQRDSPADSSNPTELTAFNGNLYFAATGNIYGRELWKSNGELNQAHRVSDINPGGFNSNPEDLVVLGNHLYFTANTPYGDRAIYKTKGAPNDFIELSISIPDDLTTESVNLTFNTPELLKESGGSIFYSASTTMAVRRLITQTTQETDDDGNISTTTTEEMEEENILLGRELWLTDASANGIKFVRDINPGQRSSSPNDFSSINGLLYFSADDGIHGRELWVSDGTEEGTSIIADINEGPNDSSPRSITDINGEIYFSAKAKETGRELWRLDEDSQSATRIVSAGRGKNKLKALTDTQDEFLFELANQFGKAKADRITGFSPADGDQLALSTNAFSGLSVVNLVTVTSKRQLKSQKTQPSNLIYFEPKGKLYFDRNGSDPGYGDDGGLFAILKGGPDLAESSFRIV